MKPYYEHGGITIYHGDCREVMPTLEADVMVTDPPYGMSYVSHSAWAGPSDAIENDDSPELRDGILALWNGPALVFGTWRVNRPLMTRQLIVWDKGDSPGMGDLSMPWGPGHEEIYVLGHGFTGKRKSNVLRYPTISPGARDRPNHPTPKPVPLMIDLLKYCPADWIIVDPFLGSGTTLRAAKDLGRRAIGIELEERYCEIAAKRLSQQVLDLGGV